MRALVIDDSRSMRSILRRTLKDLGFEVVEAGNGKEALLRLEEESELDLALVDWNMPEMNGLEFVENVRRDSRFDSLPLMMVTTETEMEQMMKALSAGANEYIMKPFTKDVLLDKLVLLGFSGVG